MTARERATWAWSPRARRLNKQAAQFNQDLRMLNAMPKHSGQLILLPVRPIEEVTLASAQ